jgi:hypothetical protein
MKHRQLKMKPATPGRAPVPASPPLLPSLKPPSALGILLSHVKLPEQVSLSSHNPVRPQTDGFIPEYEVSVDKKYSIMAVTVVKDGKY